jgi:hypothetical protein
MMNITNLRRRLAQSFGIAAAAVLMMSATQRAEALSPVNAAASPIAKADALITEVRGGHGGGGGGHGGGGHGGGGGFHGGGGGFHGGGFHGGPAFHGGGGGFHGGGAVFHGGGMRAFHGGGFHHGGGGFVFARHHHHHFGSRFYGYGYEYYPTYYDYPRRCRIVWTYYGPRRVCHYHRWHHYRHHHRRHHHCGCIRLASPFESRPGGGARRWGQHGFSRPARGRGKNTV